MNPTKAARVGFAADRLPRLIAASIIVVGAAVSLVLNYPGHLEYDSIVQLAEGRTGDYAGLHPPVMSWLLGMADALRPGAWLFVVFDTLLIDGALLSFLLLRRTTSWAAAPLAGGFVAIPQLLIYPAIVWKDVLFAGAATAGFACLAYAGAFWARPVRRYGLLTAALLLLTLGALARQNGAVVLPFAAVAVAWISARSGGAGDVRGHLAHGLAFLAGAAVIAAGASAALETRVEDTSSIGQQWEELQFWDIVSAVSLEPRVDLGPLRDKAPWIETLVRTGGVAAYTPTEWDSVEPILDRIEAREPSADIIGAQWRDLIARDPLLYLRVRARAFEWVFLTPEPQDCALVFTGVDKDPQDERESLGIVRRYTQADRALEAYADRFASTPIYSHAAYGAVGLALLVVLLRRRQPPDLAVAAMLASALAFAASFAVISIGCDYRYVYYLDLTVIAAALYATGTSKLRDRNR
jgi:hypothetical protein